MNNLTHFLELSENAASLWAITRMPLQPVGGLAEAKRALRNHLKSLHAPEGNILSCEFTSLQNGNYDVENVLIHNIGDGAFRSASKNGISFRRVRDTPAHSGSGTAFPHLSRYEFVDFPAPEGTAAVAQLSFQPSSFASVFDIWWAASRASSTKVGMISGEFGLRISVGLPIRWANPGRMLKKLVDGIVCSFHADPTPDLDAVQRLSKKSGKPAAEIIARLAHPAMPILSNRKRLVSAYRNHVMWNPNDDLCVQCVLLPYEASELICDVSIYSKQGY